MSTYATCAVCQNINGAGAADCPGHDGLTPPRYWRCMVCGAKGYDLDIALCYEHRNSDFVQGVPTAWQEPDHECTLPTVCGLTDPYSEMAGMSGPDHILRCSNAPDPMQIVCQCGGKTPICAEPAACQWCGGRF